MDCVEVNITRQEVVNEVALLKEYMEILEHIEEDDPKLEDFKDTK